MNRRIGKTVQGFSMVEIMVGIAISMIAVVAMLQSLSMFEAPRRAVTANSEMQANGSLALFTLERDIRMAGYGIALPAALGCKVNSYYSSNSSAASALPSPLTLMPLQITKGANGLPDTIQVLYSDKRNFSMPARVVTDHPPQADNFFVNTVLGIAPQDMMIAYEAGKDCTLFQVTDVPASGAGSGNVQIHHSSGQSPWNPPGGQNIFPSSGYTTNAMLFNLGGFALHAYSIDTGNNLQLASFAPASNSSARQALFANIVNLKAQYGFDTQGAADGRVDTWSDAMIDADGDGVTGDSGDVQRMYAVRIAVVVRSATMEKPNAGGTCDYYTRTPAAFKNPAWTTVDATSGADVSTLIDVSKNPDGSANPAWQCYRYGVYETVIPLRNLVWSNS